MSETTQARPIPEDVCAFARARGVEAQLPAVLEAAGQLLPDVTGTRCVVEDDPEAEGVAHLVVVLSGADPDMDQTLATYRTWHRLLFDLVGAPNVCHFQLELERPA